VVLSAALYAAWVLATYLLEGGRRTFLRPEAVADRVTYALVANLLVGTVAATWAVRVLAARGAVAMDQVGLRSRRLTGFSVMAAAAAGLGLFILQPFPTSNAVVIGNVFAQALPVSVAEVMVCWVVCGGAVRSTSKPWGEVAAKAGAWLASAGLFGLYHFAHSPPYDTWATVGFLTSVGLVTGAFFYLIAGEVYGTVLLHNCLATVGVMKSLDAAGKLGQFQSPNLPLYVMAGLAVFTVVLLDVVWVRRAAAGWCTASTQ
jgi:hypothetical protein